MEEITLQALLEAGCHFGHKSERWHPKAAEFIYIEKDGIHIIDLAKTKAGLEEAVQFVKDITKAGGEVLFVGTKRQARGVVKEEAGSVGAPYLVERWIGGFLTNWDGIRKNIEKINRMSEEQVSGAWKKYPKHEQSKLARYLARLKVLYGGVLTVKGLPSAMFIIDVKKEYSAVREAIRREIPVIAVIDTNADPRLARYAIPANDDAVGSIQFITHMIAKAYEEGKNERNKEEQAETQRIAKEEEKKIRSEEKKKEEKVNLQEKKEVTSEKKKRGRPKKKD